MCKFIKAVNWPYVELKDAYNGTIIINAEDISTVWDNPNTYHKYGILFKSGIWYDNFKTEGLTELKDLLMNRKVVKIHHETPGANDSEIELMKDGKTLDEWLAEEYHCCDA